MRRANPDCTAAPALELHGPVELAVLAVKKTAARCRLLLSGQTVTLRAYRHWDLIPGEIVLVVPRKQWTCAGHLYLSGAIQSTRLDAAALSLVPLGLEDRDLWYPLEHYWDEEGEPIEDWAKPIIARGPRQEFEMEQVLPGADPEDPFSDPIGESIDRKDSGDNEGVPMALRAALKTGARECRILALNSSLAATGLYPLERGVTWSYARSGGSDGKIQSKRG